MIIKFKKFKETKNTIRYQEVLHNSDEKPAIGTFYVQKWAAKDRDELTVSIKEL